MSFHLSLAVIVMLLYVISQLGSRLSARHSFVWLLISVFIVWSVLFPTSLGFIAHFFGVQLVSNFVLASMIFFLFLQTLSLHTDLNSSNNRTRQIVSAIASKEFVATNPPILSVKAKKRVLIVVPCYNEEASISIMIERLNAFRDSASNAEWAYDYCIVDDGSTDTTERILEKSAAQRYIRHTINQGVAGALLTGFFIAEKIGVDYVVQCDADGQHPTEKIHELAQYADSRKTDLMIGSRFATSSAGPAEEFSSLESTTALRRSGGILITLFLRLFGFKNTITDPTSGFRCYSHKASSILKKMMPEEYPEPESIAILGLKHCKIEEMHVRMNKREQGVSSISGMKSLKFMVKVSTALFGLRLRTLMRKGN